MSALHLNLGDVKLRGESESKADLLCARLEEGRFLSARDDAVMLVLMHDGRHEFLDERNLFLDILHLDRCKPIPVSLNRDICHRLSFICRSVSANRTVHARERTPQ